MSTATFSQAALEHLDSLYGYALILTRDQTAAEDLVQETYLRAVRAFGQLMANSNLKRWLFVIMRNAWLNQLRHTRTGARFLINRMLLFVIPLHKTRSTAGVTKPG